MMKTLMQNWNFMRILRIVLGGVIVYQSYITAQPMVGLLGGLFMLQGFLNMGCGIGGSCAPRSFQQTNSHQSNEVDYEEVKGV